MKVICFFQCVDISTDGSKAMVGETVATLIKAVAPNRIISHCVSHFTHSSKKKKAANTHEYSYYASVMDVLGKTSNVVVRNSNSFWQGTTISIEKNN